MKSVILTGASGFLGAAVHRSLLKQGWEVHALQHTRPVGQLPGTTILAGGLEAIDARLIDRVRPAAILHCARPTMPRLRSLGRYLAAWKAASINRKLLREVTASATSPPLFFASGSLVYGNSDRPHGEDAPLRPVSYARQYHSGEMPLLDALRAGHPVLTILRYPWILGEGSWFAWFYRKPALEMGFVPLFGEGSNRMTIVSLAGAAETMVRCMENGPGTGIVNILSHVVLTQKEFAEKVALHYGAKVVPFREVFPKGIGKAEMEAFTSNILLHSRHPGLQGGDSSVTIENILRGEAASP